MLFQLVLLLQYFCEFSYKTDYLRALTRTNAVWRKNINQSIVFKETETVWLCMCVLNVWKVFNITELTNSLQHWRDSWRRGKKAFYDVGILFLCFLFIFWGVCHFSWNENGAIRVSRGLLSSAFHIKKGTKSSIFISFLMFFFVPTVRLSTLETVLASHRFVHVSPFILRFSSLKLVVVCQIFVKKK